MILPSEKEKVPRNIITTSTDFCKNYTIQQVSTARRLSDVKSLECELMTTIHLLEAQLYVNEQQKKKIIEYENLPPKTF